MNDTKQQIIENVCYTDLVYGRINKKLGLELSSSQIESFILCLLEETDASHFSKKGKNYYITDASNTIRVTINSSTYRVITVDRLSLEKRERILSTV